MPLFLHLVSPAAEVVVSNLRRIRIRSNSTGAKHSSPKEAAGPRRFGNQLETPDKQRLPCGGKVPKSASVSALSLIITTGTEGHQHNPRFVTEMWLPSEFLRMFFSKRHFSCFRRQSVWPPAQSHLPALALLQSLVPGLLPQPRPDAQLGQSEASHCHPHLGEEVRLHPAGHQGVHGRQRRLHCAPHGVGEYLHRISTRRRGDTQCHE